MNVGRKVIDLERLTDRKPPLRVRQLLCRELTASRLVRRACQSPHAFATICVYLFLVPGGVFVS
jgi:hypothetical protein